MCHTKTSPHAAQNLSNFPFLLYFMISVSIPLFWTVLTYVAGPQAFEFLDIYSVVELLTVRVMYVSVLTNWDQPGAHLCCVLKLSGKYVKRKVLLFEDSKNHL